MKNFEIEKRVKMTLSEKSTCTLDWGGKYMDVESHKVTVYFTADFAMRAVKVEESDGEVRCYVAVKSKGYVKREEYEYCINVEAFELMMRSTAFTHIARFTGYNLPDGIHIKVFHKDDDIDIIVEKEFEDAHEVFEKTNWAVTYGFEGDPTFEPLHGNEGTTASYAKPRGWNDRD